MVSICLVGIKRVIRNLRSNGGPTDKTPVLLDTSGKGNLLADARAGGGGEDKLSGILLDGGHLGTGGGGTNVDHDDFVLGELVDLGLLAVGGADTEKAAEEVEVDLDLGVDLGEAALFTEDETDETIGTAEGRVDAGTDTDETTGHGVLEVVGLGVEGNDSAEDGSALEVALVVTGDDTRTDLDLVAELEDTVEDGTTGNTTLELVDLGTGLVDIEGTNDDHLGVHGEVPRRNGDGVDDGIVDGVDVELELGGDGDNGRLSSNGTTDELEDRLVVLLGGLLAHKIDLVLEDDDLVELHNLDGSQMFGGLGLGAGFVSGNQEESGVHDGGT